MRTLLFAQEAAAALEAAVNREKAGSGTGGNSQLHRAHSLRNVRGAGVPPPSPASSMAGARRTSARAPGRLRRCESMGDLWKGAGTPASRSIDADKVRVPGLTCLLCVLDKHWLIRLRGDIRAPAFPLGR